MLAISYIALMSMRKLSAALNFILITSLRNKIIINITDSYFKSLFNSNKMKKNENTGDITQRLNQAVDEMTTLLRNISHNLLPPLLQLLFSISMILVSGDLIVALLFIVYFFIYLYAKKTLNPKIVSLYSDFYSSSVKNTALSRIALRTLMQSGYVILMGFYLKDIKDYWTLLKRNMRGCSRPILDSCLLNRY